MAQKNKSNYSAYKARQEKKGTPVSPALKQTSLKDTKLEKTPLRGKHKKPAEIFSLEEANDRLYDIFKNHSFSQISHEQRRALAHYYRLLMLNQEKENFTRLLTLKDIAIKHFLDSLLVPTHCQLRFPLLDLGTGPGLPGIPLKVFFPEEKILLAEGVQKRVTFLKHCREEMKLKNLDIIGRNIFPDFVYPVQGVITRAVEDITNTMNHVMGCLQVGGKIYFMKGPGVDPELAMANQAMSEYYTLENDITYEIPNTPHHRRLIVFKKIKSKSIDDFADEDEP